MAAKLVERCLATTALAGVFLAGGYGRIASAQENTYSADRAAGTDGTFTFSDAVTGTNNQQTFDYQAGGNLSLSFLEGFTLNNSVLVTIGEDVTSDVTISGPEPEGGATDPSFEISESAGSNHALRVHHSGAGSVAVDTSAGAISSAGGNLHGVYVHRGVDTTGGDITLTLGDVSAGGTGGNAVLVAQRTLGDVKVDTTAGAITSSGGYGVYVYRADADTEDAQAGDVSITTANVTAEDEAVRVRHNGSGAVTVTTSSGTLESTAGRGISLSLGSSASDDANVTSGVITAAETGVYLSHEGTGNVTVDTSAGAVTSSSGYGVYVYRSNLDIEDAQTGDVSITTANVTAEDEAVRVRHEGSGAVTVTTSSGTLTSNDGRGIDIKREAGTQGAVTVTAGAVTSAKDSVLVTHYGSGSITVNTTAGAVTSSGGHGVYVYLSNLDTEGAQTGDVSITTANVTAEDEAVRVRHEGSGAVTVTTSSGTLTSNDGRGIDIKREAGTQGAVTVTAGAVTANGDAVRVFHYGVGQVTVDSRAGALESTGGYGVYVYRADADIDATETTPAQPTGDVSIITDHVSASGQAVLVDQHGGGNVSIDTTNGDLSSTGGQGLDVTHEAAGDISIFTGNVTAAAQAVKLRHNGTGNVSVDATGGDLSGVIGLDVQHTGEGDVTVRTGAVTSASDGVYVTHYGSGSITVDTTAGRILAEVPEVDPAEAAEGEATGEDAADPSARGVYAYLAGDGDISISTAGVTATDEAVRAYVKGAGSISVDTSGGAVVSDGEQAIDLLANGDGALSVTTDDVTADEEAIRIHHYGAGDITVDTTAGDVGSDYDRGAYVFKEGAGGIDVRVGDVTAYDEALDIDHYSGSGDVTIDTSDGTLTSKYESALLVRVREYVADADDNGVIDTGNVKIVTGKVESYEHAIDVRHERAGTLTINSTGGGLTSKYGAGIELILGAAAGDAFVTSGDITAEDEGINVYHYGTGDVTVDMTAGAVSSTSEQGLYLGHDGVGDVVVRTGRIVSYEEAVQVDHSGTGTVSVDTTAAAVESTGDSGLSLFATGAVTDVTVETGNVSAHYDGVFVDHAGVGSLRVDTTGGSVQSLYGDGVDLIAGAGTSGVVLETADVTALDEAVQVYNLGSGQVTVDTIAGAVESRNEQAMYVYASGASDVEIRTGDVAGYEEGILVRHAGSGAVTLDTTAGKVTSAYQEGLFIRAEAANTINLEAAGVSAYEDAVRVTHEGTGNITVDTTAGAVVSSTNRGVHVDRPVSETGAAVSGDVTVRTGAVTSASDGVYVTHYGSGSITVDTTAGRILAEVPEVDPAEAAEGEATGEDAADPSARGVYAYLAGDGDISISTAGVTATDEAVRAYVKGAGSISVDTSGGAVVSDGEQAIDLLANGDGALSVTTDDVTADEEAIRIHHYGAGDITVDTTAGDVVSVKEKGLALYGSGGAIAARVGNVAGSATADGVYLRLAPPSDVDVSGTRGTGSVDVAAGATVSGGDAGISVALVGAPRSSIDTPDVRIAIGAGASVSGSVDAIEIIRERAADGTFSPLGRVEIDNAGTLSNASGAANAVALRSILIDAPSDPATDSAATQPSASGRLGPAAETAASNGLLLRNSGTLIGGLSLGNSDDVVVNTGRWVIAGSVSDFGGGADRVEISQGGTLVLAQDGDVAEATVLNGLERLEISGTVDLRDGGTGDTLTIEGDVVVAGGTILLEVDLTGDSAAFDGIRIDGDLEGIDTGTVDVSLVGTGAPTGNGQNDGLSLIDVSGEGGFETGGFRLGETVQSGLYLYDDLVLGTDGVWRLQSQLIPTAAAFDVLLASLAEQSPGLSYQARRGGVQATGSGRLSAWTLLSAQGHEGDASASSQGVGFEQSGEQALFGVDMRLGAGIVASAFWEAGLHDVDYESDFGSGEMESHVSGLGAALTYVGQGERTFIDAQVRHTDYDLKLTGLPTQLDASRWMVSLEAGHRFDLGGGWQVVPQLQATRSVFDIGDLDATTYGEGLVVEEADSLRLRAGGVVERMWQTPGGLEHAVWVSADATRELEDAFISRISAQGQALSLERALEDEWATFGLGARFGVNAHATAFASLGSRVGGDDTTTQGRFGFALRW